MAWLAVITAGFLEVGFASMLKLSNNFTKIWPSIGFLVFATGSFSLLAWSLKVLPIGTAYAVWTGRLCCLTSQAPVTEKVEKSKPKLLLTSGRCKRQTVF